MADSNTVNLTATPRPLGTVPAPATGAPRDSASIRAMAQALLDMIAGAALTATPTGTVAAYAGAAAPEGWLLCDGRAVSRSTYAGLFNVIGTRYGVGDGSTTFNLPDLRGRFVLGTGQGVGLTNRTLGSVGGEEAHALTLPEMPAHQHNSPTAANTSPGSYEVPPISGGGINGFASYDYGGAAPTSSAGGNAPHNNMPPYLALNYIIRW